MTARLPPHSLAQWLSTKSEVRGVRTGRGRLAVLEGPAGIGKTALLAEAMRRADRLGFLVLHGGGARLESEYAFGVVRQLFAPVLGRGTGVGDLFEGAARLAWMPLGLGGATEEPGSTLRRGRRCDVAWLSSSADTTNCHSSSVAGPSPSPETIPDCPP